MSAALRNVIALSVMGGAGLYLCPAGGPRRVMSLLCTAMIGAAILAPLRELDFDLLSLQEARLSSAEADILQRSRQSEALLQKLTLQKNCEDYIEEKGRSLGLTAVEATVELRWDREAESWLPFSVRIRASGSKDDAERLRCQIRDELGIPPERQEWTPDE